MKNTVSNQSYEISRTDIPTLERPTEYYLLDNYLAIYPDENNFRTWWFIAEGSRAYLVHRCMEI